MEERNKGEVKCIRPGFESIIILVNLGKLPSICKPPYPNIYTVINTIHLGELLWPSVCRKWKFGIVHVLQMMTFKSRKVR